jgi:hypothetical protein
MHSALNNFSTFDSSCEKSVKLRDVVLKVRAYPGIWLSPGKELQPPQLNSHEGWGQSEIRYTRFSEIE